MRKHTALVSGASFRLVHFEHPKLATANCQLCRLLQCLGISQTFVGPCVMLPIIAMIASSHKVLHLVLIVYTHAYINKTQPSWYTKRWMDTKVLGERKLPKTQCVTPKTCASGKHETAYRVSSYPTPCVGFIKQSVCFTRNSSL